MCSAAVLHAFRRRDRPAKRLRRRGKGRDQRSDVHELHASALLPAGRAAAVETETPDSLQEVAVHDGSTQRVDGVDGILVDVVSAV